MGFEKREGAAGFMMQFDDVVVIGSGISGTAPAYELARAGVTATLVEQGTLASMASGWTLGSVRQSGRHPTELPLATAAVTRSEQLGEELAADVAYRQESNLRLARSAEEEQIVRAVVAEQRSLGLNLSFLPDNAAMREAAPALAESVVAASCGATDGDADRDCSDFG
jgi:sarcosine oxidase subunit beta